MLGKICNSEIKIKIVINVRTHFFSPVTLIVFHNSQDLTCLETDHLDED